MTSSSHDDGQPPHRQITDGAFHDRGRTVIYDPDNPDAWVRIEGDAIVLREYA